VSSRIDLGEVALRESEQTEWKANVADVNDVVATLCAFANDLQNLGGGSS
jgi:ATP-dependent DNA helicase RecG